MIALALFVIGAAAGFGARHSFAAKRFSTFDGGLTWFHSGDVKRPVTNEHRLRCLRALKIDVSPKEQLVIEVIE